MYTILIKDVVPEETTDTMNIYFDLTDDETREHIKSLMYSVIVYEQALSYERVFLSIVQQGEESTIFKIQNCVYEE